MTDFIAYKITCVPTGKIYIGLTTQTLRVRWNQHLSAARDYKTKIARAIRKYGRDSFRIEHIASAFDFEGLKNLEILLIEQEDSYRHGLNTTKGGDGVLGNVHDDDARKKMSEAQIEIGLRPETIKRRSDAAKKAWAIKPSDEREKHRARAAETLKRNHEVGLIKKRPRKEKPALGKGYNMKIKTHCPQGHAYEGENLGIGKNGRRICKACKRATRNSARDRKRAEMRGLKDAI